MHLNIHEKKNTFHWIEKNEWIAIKQSSTLTNYKKKAKNRITDTDRHDKEAKDNVDVVKERSSQRRE